MNVLFSTHEASGQDFKSEKNFPCREKNKSKTAWWYGKVVRIIYACAAHFYSEILLVVLLKWLCCKWLCWYIFLAFQCIISGYGSVIMLVFNDDTLMNNESCKEIAGSWMLICPIFHMKTRRKRIRIVTRKIQKRPQSPVCSRKV